MKQNTSLIALAWPVALVLMASTTASCRSRISEVTQQTKATKDQRQVLESPCESFTLQIEGEIAFQAKKRALHNYESAGPYCFDFRVKSDKLAALRAFVWEHWQEHVLGYFAFVAFSKEGKPQVTYGFIEPDKGANWHVTITNITETPVSPSIDRSIGERSENTAFGIDRIEIPKDELHPPTIIRENEIRTAESYFVRFKDKTGRVMTRL